MCALTGAGWDGNDFTVPWFNEKIPLSSGKETEQVLWLHYLISEGTRPPTGRLVAYRDLAGAGFYEPSFIKRAVNPLAKRFGRDPGAFLKAGAACGGRQADNGDVSVVLNPLPHLPVTYILWLGDEEFPAQGNILFDQTASGWLPAEDLTVLASLSVYRMIKLSFN